MTSAVVTTAIAVVSFSMLCLLKSGEEDIRRNGTLLAAVSLTVAAVIAIMCKV